MHKFFGPIVVFFFVHSSNTNAGPLYFTQMSEVQVTLNEQYTYLTENSAHALIYSPAQVPDGFLQFVEDLVFLTSGHTVSDVKVWDGCAFEILARFGIG